ncbi:flagellar FlbD family protein [Lentibacillus sp. N15]|uniref:flagellar FlbD family protein n=1 Tax=Lentibacillus songyuanensis TaxID=3136161 RepID=UPI0031BA810A
MITLTRLNNETFTLNACLIEQLQSYPDTTITLVNGKKLVVKETEARVAELITYYYRKIGFHVFVNEAGDVNE